MGVELKPCPFCGSEDVHIAGALVGDTVVMCGNCGVEGPCDDFEEDDAIAAWNTRHQPNGGAGVEFSDADALIEWLECVFDKDEPDTWEPAKAAIAGIRSWQKGAGAEEMSPEFTDSARAAIAWVLWHHQGGSSAVGQPLRFALGMGAYEELPVWRITEAKRWAEATGSRTEDFHRAGANDAREVVAYRINQHHPRHGVLPGPWLDVKFHGAPPPQEQLVEGFKIELSYGAMTQHGGRE